MLNNLSSVFGIFARNPSFAYLDPGTGSLIIQIMIGGFAAIGISIKIFWKNIKNLFSRSKID